MRQSTGTLTIATNGKGLYEVTREVAAWVGAQGITTGLLTMFCRHTSASLLIQENAAAAVRRDLADWFERAVPEDFPYEHDDEGPDDMPAHIRSALTQVSLSIPVADGEMMLGTWQGVYLFEHRRAAHHRALVLHIIGA